MKRAVSLLVGTLAIAATLTAASPSAQNNAPTFTKDVAPIIFEKCAGCHRPFEVAPMTLMSYDDARPWAKAIKAKVVAREMPPWGADPEHSLPMRNDRSLTEKQIDTIARWVDAGAPRGNPADLPAAPKFAEGWTFGREPDFVIEMPLEVNIPAEGELAVQNFYTKVPFDVDRFAEVVELRPGNRAVVHHSGIYFVDLPEGATLDDQGRIVRPAGSNTRDGARNAEFGLPGSSKLLSFVPGRGVDAHRPDVGKRIPAGKYINWQMHYNPIGKPQTDRSRLGIWFNKVPVKYEVLIRQAGDPLATTKGAVSLYRAEGKEVEYSRGRERRAPPQRHAEHSSVRVGLAPDRYHADHRGHHALRDVAAHALARQEPEVGDHLPGRPRRDDPRRCRRSTSTGRSTTSWPSR